MKEKRVYNEAQLQVVRLSGKAQLLAESESGGNPSPSPLSAGAVRQDYISGANPLQ